MRIGFARLTLSAVALYGCEKVVQVNWLLEIPDSSDRSRDRPDFAMPAEDDDLATVAEGMVAEISFIGRAPGWGPILPAVPWLL